MVCARACKYDTKFYLISLPRDTTPKFIHRWFIHTISSLAFNRIPLSTRRICQLNKPNVSFGLENIAHWKHARLHLRVREADRERDHRSVEGGNDIDKSEIPFTLHISGYFVFVIFPPWKFSRINTKWSTHISIVFISGLFHSFCVLRGEPFSFASFS